jgi:hypothetical protein
MRSILRDLFDNPNPIGFSKIGYRTSPIYILYKTQFAAIVEDRLGITLIPAYTQGAGLRGGFRFGKPIFRQLPRQILKTLSPPLPAYLLRKAGSQGYGQLESFGIPPLGVVNGFCVLDMASSSDETEK